MDGDHERVSTPKPLCCETTRCSQLIFPRGSMGFLPRTRDSLNARAGAFSANQRLGEGTIIAGCCAVSEASSGIQRTVDEQPGKSPLGPVKTSRADSQQAWRAAGDVAGANRRRDYMVQV